MIKRVKAKYFADVFHSKIGNVSDTWRSINLLLNRRTKKDIPIEVTSDGNTITEPNEIAECFNTYFSNVAQKLSDQIPYTNSSPLSFMGDRINSSFFVAPVSINEVMAVINTLKCKSFNLSSVPTFVLKHCADLLSPVITELFNMSVRVGKFPSNLKIARVVPVFKTGERNQTNNYRPISNLTDISKIFEKLMYKRLLEFVKRNNILSTSQFGFQQNSSTSDAVLEFLDNVYHNLDVRNSIVSVFLDFSKAFDTVKHDIMVQKLDYLGIRGLPLEWFRSYLYRRQQYVDVGGHVSALSDIRMGVPQGSILGPMLFLLYINDMSRCSPKLNFIHFADDTTVFLSGTSVDGVVEQVNTELEKVEDWLYSNVLSLNVTKTSYMIITDAKSRVARPVSIAGSIITLVEKAKFLGVIVDDKLNFKAHVQHVIRSVSRSIGMINRMSTIAPPRIKKTLYYSLVYSRVSYGIVAWGRGSVCSAARLERLLRKVRAIVAYPRPPMSNITCNLLNFDSIYNYFTAMKMYKVINLNHHMYFHRIFNSLKPIHNHLTRFSSQANFNTPQLYKSKCQNSFLYQSVNVWNSLTNNTRSCSSLVSFKFNLKRELLLGQY